jgi:hypothetical protein
MSLASFLGVVQAQEATVEAIKARIEGVYDLQEWHRNGEVVRPPLVDGRTVLLNGQIIYISHDRGQETNKRTIAGFGTYVLEPGKFSYSYESQSWITETPSGVTLSEKLLFEGVRTFTVTIENDGVHFRATNGPQEFRFTPEGMSYSDDKILRVLRRVTE